MCPRRKYFADRSTRFEVFMKEIVYWRFARLARAWHTRVSWGAWHTRVSWGAWHTRVSWGAWHTRVLWEAWASDLRRIKSNSVLKNLIERREIRVLPWKSKVNVLRRSVGSVSRNYGHVVYGDPYGVSVSVSKEAVYRLRPTGVVVELWRRLPSDRVDL